MNAFKMSFLFAFVCLICCVSCDDDTVDNDNSLYNSWSLRNVSGGLQGTNIDYTQGQVTWTFQTDNTVLIEKNISTTGPEDIYGGPESGTYPYDTYLQNGLDYVLIDSMQGGSYTISNDTLRIDEGLAVDGLLYIFVK